VPFFSSALVILWSTCCLEHVLVRELHMAINVLQPVLLAEAQKLIMDEAILDVVVAMSSIIACQLIVGVY
jgi:hypothetical protein